MSTLNKLIMEYVRNINLMDQMSLDEYDDGEKVRQNNQRATRNREIARAIEKRYPELKQEFSALLCSEESSIRGWVAHHMLEVMCYDLEHQLAALAVIRDIADTDDTIQGIGNRMWLEQWERDHPEMMDQ